MRRLLLRCMSPGLALNGPTLPVWRCPLFGEDRKSRFGAVRTAVDPKATLPPAKAALEQLPGFSKTQPVIDGPSVDHATGMTGDWHGR